MATLRPSAPTTSLQYSAVPMITAPTVMSSSVSLTYLGKCECFFCLIDWLRHSIKERPSRSILTYVEAHVWYRYHGTGDAISDQVWIIRSRVPRTLPNRAQ